MTNVTQGTVADSQFRARKSGKSFPGEAWDTLQEDIELARDARAFSVMSQWRSLQLFNSYRLALALALLFVPIYGDLGQIGVLAYQLIRLTGVGLLVCVMGGLLLSIFWRRHFFLQLSAQVVIDAIAVGIMAFLYEGVQGGLSLVLLLSIAGASLVTMGKLAPFYAAVASLSVLGSEYLFGYFEDSREANYVPVGIFCLGLFVVAIAANYLGRRVARNEEIARRRSIERNTQMQINRQIMEAMQDGVMVIDVRERILKVNARAREMLAMATRHCEYLPESLPALSAAYRKWRWQKGQSEVSLAATQLSGDGKTREVMARFMLTQSDDKIALIFLEDVARLREEALQLKFASLGRLTANIAHEIRNPLSAISHATELLQEEIEAPYQDRLMHIIGDNTRRIECIVRDVLILGLGGNRENARAMISLAEWLPEVVQEISAQEGVEAGVIEAHAYPELQLAFVPAQLQQVVWNLVSNALRYASRQKGAVRLEARAGSHGVELHVIDNGPGIDASLRDQIFEPFFTTSTRGTGLGLYIVRELCEANGASIIIADEEEDGGAHFIVQGASAA
jgi:two-component system sensor histidine kinase PilS (NtrC family)